MVLSRTRRAGEKMAIGGLLPKILKKIDVESVEFSSRNLNDVFMRFTALNTKEQPEGGFMEKFARYD